MVQITARVSQDLNRVRVSLEKFRRTLTPTSLTRMRLAMERAKRISIPWLGGNVYAIPLRSTPRTGYLGSSSLVVTEGYSTRIKVGAWYAPFVIGRADGTGQAQVHQGWWVPLKVAVDIEVGQLAGDTDEAIQAQAEAMGL